ncbi:hypothetical protein [Longispora fulva]|uniref:Uncharacterized protein n=1 Tax=Longispora fulva TaxID=619741 RepID=A0A8J7GIS7_9ACTN|nr:hypothetical protein [Longispora fulva]MBG6137497.1 hypothetical protein [Longispora fulva]
MTHVEPERKLFSEAGLWVSQIGDEVVITSDDWEGDSARVNAALPGRVLQVLKHRTIITKREVATTVLVLQIENA